MKIEDFSEELRVSLKNLPGRKFQNEMAPAGRSQIDPESMQSEARLAAVMLLVYPAPELQIAIIERTPGKGIHASQLALPGGQLETVDEGFLNAAIRETREEVGVKISEAEVQGVLTTLYIPPSNYYIKPFVAVIDYNPQWNLNGSEVRHLYGMSLESLLNQPKNKFDLEVRGRLLKSVPGYECEGGIIWGATAMILSEFAESVKRFRTSI